MSAYLVLPLVQAFCGLVLAAIVWRGPFTHRLFSFFLICLALWGIIIFGMRASPDIERAFFWDRLVIPLSPLMTVLFYHFSVRYTGTRINSNILPLFYSFFLISIPLAAAGLIFSGMQVKSYGYAPIFGPVWPVWILLLYAITIMTLLNFIRARRAISYGEERNRLSYIIVGIIISLVGGIFDALPVLGLPLYPGAILATIVFCVLTTIAIMRYNLLDINFLLRKTTAYLLTSTIVAVPVAGLFFLAVNIPQDSPLEPWLYVALIILLAIAMPALWGQVQNRVDRWYYRDRYNYLKALEAFSWHTQSLSDFAGVGHSTVGMVAGALHASSVYLLQPLSRSADFRVAYAAGGEAREAPGVVFKAGGPLLAWLKHSGGVLRYRDIEVIPQLQNVIWEEKECLKGIGAELIAPLKSRGGEVSGLLLVGRKLSGQPYGVEDVQLVTTISHQIAVTLENMRLYQDIVDARESLETWLNGMNNGVMIIDMNRKVRFMNEAARKAFGDDGHQECWKVLGREGICPDCPIPESPDGKISHPRHIGDRTIKGREYEVAMAPLLNPDGSTSLISVFRDITERKRLEEEIIEARVKIGTLRQSEQLKDDLLSMVSHELRTPLAIIKGYTTTFLRNSGGWGDKKDLDFLLDIDQETDYLTKLVGNLLDMSRLDAGAVVLDKDWYQLAEILEWADRALKTVTRDHRVKVVIPPGLPDIYVDRIRLGQVLTNLCENAAKYSAKGSRITIAAELSGASVIISVSDEGKGIPPQNRERVFERFYRVRSNKDPEKGIGLGLSICRAIVESHGGRIWGESEEGRGSRFSFSLPVSEKENTRLKLR